MKTIRQHIIELLLEGELSALEISGGVGISEKEVYEHLPHVARSVAADKKRLFIRPSECTSCGFIFKDRRRFTPPGRCPRCRNDRLINPLYRIR